MSDSSTPLTWTQFQVDMQQLADAIQTVGGHSSHLQKTVGYMQTNFQMVRSMWTTPTSPSYELVEDWFNNSARELSALLDEIVARLQSAYDYYLSTETTNTNNSS